MLYKVLLVDDEAWVLESLKASVNWETQGFEVAGTALSGQEALAMIGEMKPDVVFTDIRMPGMNGLELIKKGSELPDRVLYIVVSGYAEFAYAQKALTYGAVAYCLKPFDEDEILSILGKIRRDKDGERMRSGKTLQAYLEEPGDGRLEAALATELRELNGWSGEDADIGAIVCSLEGAIPTIASGTALYAKIGKSKHLFLAPWSRVETFAERLRQELGDAARGIGIGGRIADMRKLQDAVNTAGTLADHAFIAGRTGIFRAAAPPDKESFNAALKQLGGAIGEGDVAASSRAFDAMEALFREGGLTVRYALQLYNIVHSFLYRYKAETTDNMLYSVDLLMASFRTFADMLIFLRQFVSRYMLETPEFAAQETGNETFRAILQYVNQNYLQELSVQSLSQRFYTNPSYISQLFKKEVGETYTSYIAKLRITYACELLSSTSMMIGEIAEKAGYPDYFYFTKLFKKAIGKTPSQFRAEMK
ncbi:response regulator [Paenibacillus sp. LHD-117]|uniref:response regulator transcription factor n=1 Tax=Paenibacillus sp. LHD-117 TaxID=3071412 RepID=UPI0027E0703E|nr:response regulator [Paenibacillus sp. LHD-117]MDQ6421862.1 response regulator [Paenibacillus sp. LHD-117]